MEKARIQGIFNRGNFLKIPYFQRSYVWKEENWTRFLEDMKDTSASKKEYFMGSYIMKQINTGISDYPGALRSVIDGQQRLTTLVLFFLVLTQKQNNLEGYFKGTFLSIKGQNLIIHNHNDKEIFDTLVLNQELTPELEKKYENNNILKAYKFFEKEIKPEEFDIDVLLNAIYFYPIDLQPNDDEQQIFDTINSLGVRLNTAELLKNYIFSAEEENLYNEYWRKNFEADQEIKDFWNTKISKREDSSNIDIFLYAFLNIKKNKSEVKYRTLFKDYKEYIDDNGYNKDLGSKETFLSELMAYANLYYSYINPNIENEVLEDKKNSIKRINFLVFALDTSTILPYCLFVLKNAEPKEQEYIFGYIETYIIRRMLCHCPTKNYTKKFKSFISENILTFNALKDKLQNNDTEDKLPTDDDLNVYIKEFNHTNLQAKGILYLLETGLRTGKDCTSVLPVSKYDLEHIMPKDWEKHWKLKGKDNTKENKENRKKSIGCLGNKTLLSGSLNKAIKNSDFVTKKTGKNNKYPGYNEYARGLHIFEFENLQDWDEQSIEKRFKQLLKLIKKVWEYAPVY